MNKQNHRTTYQREIANLFEQLDIPRAPAQIAALLLVSEPPDLSFDEIGGQLELSKAAVSTAIQYLEALELVRYTTVPGTRRRHVHLNPAQIVNYLRRRMKFLNALKQSLQAVVTLRDDSSAYT